MRPGGPNATLEGTETQRIGAAAVRADNMPGGIFSDYELTTDTKTRRRLSELQGTDPMMGLRENWEADDRSMHHPYQQTYHYRP